VNETVLERPAAIAPRETAPTTAARKSDTPVRGYIMLALAIVSGYLLRGLDYITPASGLGYWLGVIGGSMMLALLLYPLRKRIRILHFLGPTRHWFRMHMAFGLIGPLLILYHSNFEIGAINSKVAMYCMLLVAGSGIVGRHFYARIHRGLYGRKTSLRELQQELTATVDKSHGLAKLMPNVVARLGQMADELQGCNVTQTLGIRRSLRWTLTHHYTHFSLWLLARRELKLAAENSSVVTRNYSRLSRTTSKFIRDNMSLVGRVAQFSLYERLFALWHVLHLPIFLLMVLSALFHVLAVHMY
jgi:hypothetical protein